MGEFGKYLRTNQNIVFDFSALKCFNSVKINSFDNFLANTEDFINKLKLTFESVKKMSSKTVAGLFDINNNYRHCHIISGDKEKLVQKILKEMYKDYQYVLQNYDGEIFYQAGLEKDVRLIGVIKGNIFKVLFIDFFHDLFPDDKKNLRSNKTNKYSVEF